MDNFKQRKNLLSYIKDLRTSRKERTTTKQKDIPDSIFTQCDNCKNTFTREKLDDYLWVCPSCGHHIKWEARKRMDYMMDEDYIEIQDNPTYDNPLEFQGYEEKLQSNREKSGLDEAVIVALGAIKGNPCITMVMDSKFLMGSMGSYVGETITKGFEVAMEKNLPVIIFCASGGARMQEGIFSLMQMAKTSNAVRQHGEKGLLFISCLTNPTTGGVTASFASLGDIIIGEPQALIGFAGPRVIKQTIKKELPKGFQRSEFLMDHGFIDAVVHRKVIREYLAGLLRLHGGSYD